MSTANADPRTVKVSYLVVGLVYLGLVGSWALSENGVIDWGDSAYVLPTVLVAAGVIALIAMFLGRRRTALTRYDVIDQTVEIEQLDQTEPTEEIK